MGFFFPFQFDTFNPRIQSPNFWAETNDGKEVWLKVQIGADATDISKKYTAYITPCDESPAEDQQGKAVSIINGVTKATYNGRS